MRSETSFFNKTIFFKNIRRFWPVWTLYLIAFTIAMPLTIANRAFRILPYFSISQFILGNALYMGTVMSLIFGVISALAVFSYLFTARSVGAYHTLPIRREGLFITNYLSGLLWLLLSNIVIFAITALTCAFTGFSDFINLFNWLLILSLQTIFFFSFASFCVMLTGNGFALVFIYAILNFAAVIIESIMRLCISVFSYGITAGSSMTFGILSPVFKIMSGQLKSVGETYRIYYYTGWSVLIIYGAAGLVFAFFAVMIYRRRQSESASEFIAIPALRPVFKYFFAFIGSLTLGSLFYSVIFGSVTNASGSAVPMVSCMVVGGFLGYFITEMLLKKSFRVFRAASLGFLIYTLALIALMSSFEFDLFGMERYVPEAKAVSSLSIYANGVSDNFKDKNSLSDLINTHKILISNKSVYESYIRSHKDSSNSLSVNYVYTLENGRKVSRHYTLFNDIESDKAIAESLETALNTQTAIRERMQDVLSLLPDTVVALDINYTDENNVYKTYSLRQDSIPYFLANCLQADITDGNLGRVPLAFNGSYSEKSASDPNSPTCYIIIYLSNNNSVSLSPNSDSIKTLTYLKSLGISPKLSKNVKIMSPVVRAKMPPK